MQFLLIAYDGTDEGAAARREAARPAHIARVTELKAAGHIRIGGAILDESGAAVGSAAVFEFEARADLDRYLEADPYVTEGVWRDITIAPYRAAL